jgi:hypothetical protein
VRQELNTPYRTVVNPTSTSMDLSFFRTSDKVPGLQNQTKKLNVLRPFRDKPPSLCNMKFCNFSFNLIGSRSTYKFDPDQIRIDKADPKKLVTVNYI